MGRPVARRTRQRYATPTRISSSCRRSKSKSSSKSGRRYSNLPAEEKQRLRETGKSSTLLAPPPATTPENTGQPSPTSNAGPSAMTNQLPSLRRRLASMLYEGLVVFSRSGLSVFYAADRDVRFRLATGRQGTVAARFRAAHGLLRLVLAQWRPDAADEDLETAGGRCQRRPAPPPPGHPALSRRLAEHLAAPALACFGHCSTRTQQFLHDRIAGTQIIAKS